MVCFLKTSLRFWRQMWRPSVPELLVFSNYWLLVHSEAAEQTSITLLRKASAVGPETDHGFVARKYNFNFVYLHSYTSCVTFADRLLSYCLISGRCLFFGRTAEILCCTNRLFKCFVCPLFIYCET